MSITKPYTFTAGTKARANEVNADFDTLYSQVNINIADIAQNKLDIEDLESTKAEINGNATQRFAVADAVNSTDAINKQTLKKSINNTIDFISGYTIEKDINSPEDTILVNPGSCYDSTKEVVLSSEVVQSKQNASQSASTTYYVYVIGDDSGNQIDVLISTLSVTPNLPSGYTKYRQIGNYTTDSDSNISIIKSYGNDYNIPNAIATIIESYINGSSWYRIWSDGWCEQGGKVTNVGATIQTITFLKPFKDANYYINCNQPLENVTSFQTFGITSRTTESFKVMQRNYNMDAGACDSTWYACGYMA